MIKPSSPIRAEFLVSDSAVLADSDMADVDHAHEVDRNANGSRADPKLNAFTATLVSALARDDRWWPQLDQILFLAISAAVGRATGAAT